MNIIITGSIGHISRPLATSLIAAGHSVSIISSNAQNIDTIQSIGANPLIGSIEDASFLEKAFEGADAVYLMIPPKWTVTDWLEYQQVVSHNYVNAIKTNKIKKVVVLSSFGAHMGKGAGPVDGVAFLEALLNKEDDIHATYLRPSYFYYNFFSMIPMIKQAGIMGSNFSESHQLVMTHTNDIAEAAIAAFDHFDGKQVIYIASDEKPIAEVVKSIGQAIGKPELKWLEFTDEQNLEGMIQAGLSETLAKGYNDLGKAIREHHLEADYHKHKPATLGKVKLEQFIEEFVKVYSL